MARRKRKLGNAVGVKSYEGYLFLIPFLVPYLLFTFSMLIASFALSFTNFKLMGNTTFVGFDNYMTLFQDTRFWESLWNTLFYVVIATPTMVVIPLFLAILLDNGNLRLKAFFRGTFFYPQVIAVSIVATMSIYIFQPYTGLVNGLLHSLYLLADTYEIMWISDRGIVWITILLITVWRSSGYNMILYLAGMQDIPDDYYEAASLEGANIFQKIRYITIPCLSGVHVVVIFLQLISSFKVFSQIYLLTEGGPAGATRTYIQYLYEVAFTKWQIGRGSAAAFVLFIIILAVTMLQMRVSNKFSD